MSTGTAIHEAGHAAVAMRLGIPVGKTTIKPTLTAGGSCTIGPSDWRRRAVSLLAGMAAEAEFGVNRDVTLDLADGGLRVLQMGASKDMDDLAALYRLAGLSDERRLIRQFARDLRIARILVRRERSTIQSIASSLLEKRTLQLDSGHQMAMSFDLSRELTLPSADEVDSLLAACGADVDSRAASMLSMVTRALDENPDIDVLVKRLHPEFRDHKEGRRFNRGAVIHPGNVRYRAVMRRLLPFVRAYSDLARRQGGRERLAALVDGFRGVRS